MTTSIRVAGSDDYELVGDNVAKLIHELFPEYKDQYPRNKMINAAKDLLQSGTGVWALIATADDGETVGVLTLNECAAISAGGSFGEIYELYVTPDWRSKEVGWDLIQAAADFGRERNWPYMEVGAPDLPRWQRSYDFYINHGFKEIGPRLELQL
jgi:GNAT superfamily N-acetyltransferase